MGRIGMGKSAAMMWNVRTGDFVRTITGNLEERFIIDLTELDGGRKEYMDSALSSTPTQSEWIVDGYPAAFSDWCISHTSESSDAGIFLREMTTTLTDG